MKSIMHEKDATCYLCILLNHNYRIHNYVEEHHVIYGKGNRPLSEKCGLKVYLCLGHHREGKEAVHKNWENDLILKKEAQRIFEKKHSRKEFRENFGINYMDIEDDVDPYSIPQEAEWGFVPLPEKNCLSCMDEHYIRIDKDAAAKELSQEQFNNMIDIMNRLA